MKPPSKHKMVLLIWLAIYPTITLISWLLGDVLMSYPTPIRTLILTLILVPLMVYVLLPIIHSVFKSWLNK